MRVSSDLMATLLKAAKLDQQQIILCPTSMAKDDEMLMSRLSYEYRHNYSANLLDLLFGDDFNEADKSINPGFILEKVFEITYNAEQRKELMRESLKLIFKYKDSKKKSLNISHVIHPDTLPPFKKVYSLPETDIVRKESEDSYIDPWMNMFEGKRRRKELKKNHFKVKSKEIQKKVKLIQALQYKISNPSLIQTPKPIKNTSTVFNSSQVTSKSLNNRSLPHIHHSPPSLAHVTLAQTPGIKPAYAHYTHAKSSYDRYYSDMKSSLINMAAEHKRSKHLVIDVKQGGIDLICAQLSLSDNFNKINENPISKTREAQFKVKAENLMPKKQADTMLETKFDQKVGRFWDTNLPKIKKVKKEYKGIASKSLAGLKLNLSFIKIS